MPAQTRLRLLPGLLGHHDVRIACKVCSREGIFYNKQISSHGMHWVGQALYVTNQLTICLSTAVPHSDKTVPFFASKQTAGHVSQRAGYVRFVAMQCCVLLTRHVVSKCTLASQPRAIGQLCESDRQYLFCTLKKKKKRKEMA